MKIKRHDIDIRHHPMTNVAEPWRITEVSDGEWVKYNDIKHLLERSDNSSLAVPVASDLHPNADKSALR